ncbi:MAG: hypothetical protein IJ343_10290 [Clostridia bacterium]|nr:hypothetical protein [Clostridia bacterium]
MKIEIARLERAVGLIQEIKCTEREDIHYAQMMKSGQALPGNVKLAEGSTGEFVRVVGSDATDDDKRYWAALKLIEKLQELNEA